jgi:hypothetical protein
MRKERLRLRPSRRPGLNLATSIKSGGRERFRPSIAPGEPTGTEEDLLEHVHLAVPYMDSYSTNLIALP